jgi:small subunit ribosomal protein S17
MPGRQKTRIGTVVSNKMQKTVVVAVEVMKRHRLYRKTMRRTKRLKAHDEENACRLGDRVRIVETRPLSRDKRWRVAEVLVRGDVAEVAPREVGQEIIEEISVKTRPEETPKEVVPEEPEVPEAAAEEAPPEPAGEKPEAVAEETEEAGEPEEPPEPAEEEPAEGEEEAKEE